MSHVPSGEPNSPQGVAARAEADTTLRRFAAIVESTDDAVIGKRLDGTIESWNKGAERIYGYTAAEAIGKPISLLISHDRRDELQTILERLRRGERIDHFQTTRITKSGRDIDVSLTISPIIGADGATIGFSTIARDISQRIQAEQAVRESQRKLSTLMSSLPGAAYRCQNDEHWTMEFISEGCRDLCGYPASELLASKPTWSEFIHRDDREALWNEVQLRLSERQPFQAVYRIWHRSGDQRWVWEQGQGVFSEDGELLAIEGFISDMTELHRAREQLVQSERLAALGQMLSAIAHESRNALQRIQSGVDMLKFEFEEQSEAKQDLDRISRAGEDLQRLFEELRSYAVPIKLDSSKSSLASAWRQAWSDLESARCQREAELHEDTNGVDLTCVVDAFRIVQVFRNLMENSLAACADPVSINIRCAESEIAGKPAVCVTVRDNGPGLSEEQKQRMFAAFFTTKRKGTGLGMAIARRLIEAHGGRITLGDSAAPGAEFVITLPRTIE